VASLPKAWVCDHSLLGFTSSNPARGMDVCLLCVLCVVRQTSLQQSTRPEESYGARVRVCVCVCGGGGGSDSTVAFKLIVSRWKEVKIKKESKKERK
jgi:hypothetical protein